MLSQVPADHERQYGPSSGHGRGAAPAAAAQGTPQVSSPPQHTHLHVIAMGRMGETCSLYRLLLLLLLLLCLLGPHIGSSSALGHVSPLITSLALSRCTFTPSPAAQAQALADGQVRRARSEYKRTLKSHVQVTLSDLCRGFWVACHSLSCLL